MESVEVFLTLVRLGVGNYASKLPQKVDWPAVQSLATQQGLYAIVLDGIDVMRRSYESPDKRSHGDLNLPAQEMMLEWIGEVMQGYEYQYEQYCKTISDLASFYNTHGFKMMVLKGYACSLTWPKPEHRPVGDIDIWQFGRQKETDAVLTREKGIEVDNSHHHHTVFNWGDFTIENHYDFVNVHADKSSAKIEEIFKDLGKDDSHSVLINGEKVYLPSPNLHALFLLRHAVSHFASSNINIRQVLDWGFFVKKYTKDVDWEWLLGLLDKFHMKDFFNCLNAICVDDLGFDTCIFPEIRYLPEMKDKVIEDILNPNYSIEEPVRLIPRLVYKYRRWQGNAWKQELCYSESRWSAFWSGIWGHLLKPKSL